MTVKARMICQSVTDNHYAGADPAQPGVKYGEHIRLSACYSSDPESPNYSFSQATPYMETTLSPTTTG